MSKITTVIFEESTSQSRSKQITINNLKSVVKVTPNTGNTTFSISGNIVTVNVSNGAYVRYTSSPYYPTTIGTATRQTSAGGNPTSLPSTLSAVEAGYSGYTGTLSGGSASVVSGSYTAADTKPMSYTATGSGYVKDRWNGTEWEWAYQVQNYPSTYSYNSGGYSGTLSNPVPDNDYMGNTVVYYTRPTNPTIGQVVTSSTFTWKATYSGTVTKPAVDTRIWQKSYSGTLTSTTPSYSYTYYYAYSVDVEYIDNTAPSITVKNGEQTLTNNQNVLVTNKNNITLSIIPSDVDVGDTLQYSIALRGISKVPFTTVGNNTPVAYTITYTDFILGNNSVVVTVKDSAGDSTTFTVVLRNKTPATLSNKTLLDVETALGYSNSSYTSFSTLKPSGYSGKLSISDIINFLT